MWATRFGARRPRLTSAGAWCNSIPFIFLNTKGEKEDLYTGMNLGADAYLTQPVARLDLLEAIHARLLRSEQQAQHEFKPDFPSFGPLLKLGLTPASQKLFSELPKAKPTGTLRPSLASASPP